jgi:hypothetical protein
MEYLLQRYCVARTIGRSLTLLRLSQFRPRLALVPVSRVFPWNVERRPRDDTPPSIPEFLLAACAGAAISEALIGDLNERCARECEAIAAFEPGVSIGLAHCNPFGPYCNEQSRELLNGAQYCRRSRV